MDLETRIARLKDHTVYIAMREDTMGGTPFDFLDMDTVSTSRACTRRLATAHDAGNPSYAERYPLVCIVTYFAGTSALSAGD